MIWPFDQTAPSQPVYYLQQNPDQYISYEIPMYTQAVDYFQNQYNLWMIEQLRRQMEQFRRDDDQQNREDKERLTQEIQHCKEALIRKQQVDQDQLLELVRKNEKWQQDFNLMEESIQKVQLEVEKKRQTPVQRETIQLIASSPSSSLEKQKNIMIVQKETIVEEKRTGTPSENKPDSVIKLGMIRQGSQTLNLSTDTQLNIEFKLLGFVRGFLAAKPEIIKLATDIKEVIQIGVYAGSSAGGYSKSKDVQKKDEILEIIPIYELAKQTPYKSENVQKKDRTFDSKEGTTTETSQG